MGTTKAKTRKSSCESRKRKQVMSKFVRGRLRIGGRYIVTNPTQAVAISYREAATSCGILRKKKKRGKKKKRKS